MDNEYIYWIAIAHMSRWTQERKKGTGNWGQNSNYSFKGFIYNPNVKEEPKEDLVKEVAKRLGGGGGGRPEMATGQVKTAAGFEEVAQMVKEML